MATQPSSVLTAKLTAREPVAEGTMAFSFEKPAGFEFRAGQAIEVGLLDPPETDAEGNARAFSIASPPYENRLLVATRMRDTAFKRVLKSMPLGTAVKLDGPFGSLTLHKNPAKPAVFLAGGIGITPFLSMVRQAAKDKLPHPIYLFYSNRRPEDAAFLDTLSKAPQENPNFHFIPSMSEMEKSKQKWSGETGFIDAKMLGRHLSSLQGPIYYIAGPPGMVAAMRKMLAAAGADEDDIRTEEFPGY